MKNEKTKVVSIRLNKNNLNFLEEITKKTKLKRNTLINLFLECVAKNKTEEINKILQINIK
jgi:hypothetical protein